MIVENISHDSCNEAYCLITAYLREERIAGTYNSEHLKEFVGFLHDILKNPKNFRVQVDSEDEDVVVEDTGNSKSFKV